jgi:hypothetical protein
MERSIEFHSGDQRAVPFLSQVRGLAIVSACGDERERLSGFPPQSPQAPPRRCEAQVSCRRWRGGEESRGQIVRVDSRRARPRFPDLPRGLIAGPVPDNSSRYRSLRFRPERSGLPACLLSKDSPPRSARSQKGTQRSNPLPPG